MPEEVRFGLAAAMLLGATVLDFRSRRVPNPYWTPFLVAAAFLWLGDLHGGVERSHGVAAAAALLTCGVLRLLWHIGAFGGADAKGLMVLAWLWPGLPDLSAGRITPTVDTFVNGNAAAAVLFVALYLVLNLARAAATGSAAHLKVPAMFLGVRMATARAEAKHVWPLQRVQDGRLVWRFHHRPGRSLDETYHALRRAGVREVWVTPKIPFMLYLLLGLLALPAVGNVALWVAGRLV